MSLALTFTEPSTVNTTGHFLASGAVYDSGHATWVYLGFRSPGSVSSVQYSADGGLTWTMATLPSTSTYRSIEYCPTLGAAGRLVAVGNGVAAWSDDGGATWTAATSLPEANNWVDVKWWAAKSIFVMVAASGTHRVGTSADGKSWTMRTAASALAWSGIAVSATTAVAVTNSSSTSTQQVMTCTDAGITWSLQTHASITTQRGTVSTAQRHGIGYSADLDMFMITGTDGGGNTKAYRSTDSGVTWTASGTIPTLSNSTNRGYVWLSGPGSWYMPCANFNYGESTDGVTWTVTGLSTSNSGYTPMGWDNANQVLVGGSTLGFDTVLRGTIPLPAPVLISIYPPTGDPSGGASVTLTGTGFPSSPTVTLRGVAATSVVRVSSTRITCVTPAHARGYVDVTVSGSSGSSTLIKGFIYSTQVIGAYSVRRENPAITIQQAAGSQSGRATFKTDSLAPVLGTGVSVVDPLQPTAPLHFGVVMETEMEYEDSTRNLTWTLTSVENVYLLNRRRPLGSWSNTGAAAIITAIFTGYVDGFTLQIGPNLPAISIAFDGSVTMSAAFTAIANAVGGGCSWSLKDRAIHFGYSEESTYTALSQDDKWNGDAHTSVFALSKTLSYINNIGPGYVIYDSGGGPVHERITLCDIRRPNSAPDPVNLWLYDPQEGYLRAGSVIPVAGTGNVVVSYFYWGAGNVHYPQVDTFNGDGVTSKFRLSKIPTGDSSTGVSDPTISVSYNNGSSTVTDSASLLNVFACLPSQFNTYTGLIFDVFDGDGVTDTFDLSGHILAQPRQFSYGYEIFGTIVPPERLGVSYDDGLHGSPPFSYAEATELMAPTDDQDAVAGTYAWTLDRINNRITRVLGTPNAGTGNIQVEYFGIATADVGPWLYDWRQNRILRLDGAPAVGVNNVELVYEYFITTPPPAPALIDDFNTDLLRDQPIKLVRDISQLRNRIKGLGVGTTLRIAAAAGSSVLHVQDSSMFATGGSVLIDYTYYSVSSVDYSAADPTITLGSGLARDLATGAGIRIYVLVEDTDSQAAQAVIEGGDGIHESQTSFGDWLTPKGASFGSDAARALAEYGAITDRLNAELSQYSTPIETVTYATRDPYTAVGRLATFALTLPPITGQFLIQTVTIDQIHEDDITFPRYTVSAGRVRFNFNDLLQRVVLGEGGGASDGGSSGGGSGSGGGGTVSPITVYGEVPAGALNGVNTVFTTAFEYQSGTLRVYLNGVRQTTPDDYSETTTTTFTFVTAPIATDKILVDFVRR